MSTNSYNISAIQGSTLLLNINCRDSSNNYINLSGYNVRGYVREKYSSTGIILNLNPTIHPSYISGLVQISGNADDMASLKISEYPYDIELSGTNNYIFKPVRGYMSVQPECTY